MTKLMRCDYCQTLYEGLETEDCPRCLRHFHTLVAQYPSFNDEEINEENKKDPKYVR